MTVGQIVSYLAKWLKDLHSYIDEGAESLQITLDIADPTKYDDQTIQFARCLDDGVGELLKMDRITKPIAGIPLSSERAA